MMYWAVHHIYLAPGRQALCFHASLLFLMIAKNCWWFFLFNLLIMCDHKSPSNRHRDIYIVLLLMEWINGSTPVTFGRKCLSVKYILPPRFFLDFTSSLSVHPMFRKKSGSPVHWLFSDLSKSVSPTRDSQCRDSQIKKGKKLNHCSSLLGFITAKTQHCRERKPIPAAW